MQEKDIQLLFKLLQSKLEDLMEQIPDESFTLEMTKTINHIGHICGAIEAYIIFGHYHKETLDKALE